MKMEFGFLDLENLGFQITKVNRVLRAKEGLKNY